MQVAGHALLRFREHHPDATERDVVATVARGDEIDPGVANTLCGRRRKDVRGQYRLSPDRQGIFVLDGDFLVTYLRLEVTQQRFCRKHYGQGEAVIVAAVPVQPPMKFKSHKEAFRYWLGYYLWGKWIAACPQYTSKMTAEDRKTARLAIIDGRVRVEAGIVRFRVGEREATAFEIADGVVKLDWAARA